MTTETKRRWCDDTTWCPMCGNEQDGCDGHTDGDVTALVRRMRKRHAKLAMWVTTEALPALRLAETGWSESRARAERANEAAGSFELRDLVVHDVWCDDPPEER